MQEFWNNLIFIMERFTWSSLLDILLVTIFFSLLLYLLRDTDAQTLLRGIFLIVILVFLLTSLVNLPAFSWLVQTVSPALILAVPVIFAPEIRRGLERMGSMGELRFWRTRKGSRAMLELEEMLVSVTKAVVQLSERRHGALIVLSRREGLDRFYKNGVMVDSEVTPQMLLQIFYPNTPLHDGAVIISENRIKAAACVMPLSSSGVLNSTADRSLGLRHRAALGISEVSDALAVVVSEETGTVSIVHRGRLIRRLDGERLLNSMRAIMATEQSAGNKTRKKLFGKNQVEEPAEEAE
ncbi:MAG: diadenylate cyclase CdaA [Anaerolineaceae bacterium]|jgi:diadenylate cyclase|nr:diadenylate cyclase CdaA [Anaerolineaceae bacterium]MDD4042848.1 diadenylate cyclase CdaA [Anaerolineaceae bacterium]MDD4578844.1 diadenylate cyclase CdaA [Anaerolineaceae bacterium]